MFSARIRAYRSRCSDASNGYSERDLTSHQSLPQPRDLFLAHRFARHVSPLTTTVYTHPSDQEIWESVHGLQC